MSEHRPTLVRPPPVDESKAPIENALELTDLSIIGPDIFTNTRQLWQPAGSRGIYGGAVIAQTLAAAQRTVPPNFVVHSYHCFFVLAGDSNVPILYHVERVREGKSFCTRTVQARQRGSAIFTVTCSFVRETNSSDSGKTSSGKSDKLEVRHAARMPAAALANPPADDYEVPAVLQSRRGPGRNDDPFQSFRCAPGDGPSTAPEEQRVWQWMRARGAISAAGGRAAHLSALAYVSDSYFIGTVTRIHGLWRYPFAQADVAAPGADPDFRRYVERLNEWEGYGDVDSYAGRPEIAMMVSLDHSIYFHNPGAVRADQWMFTEMQSTWAADGRAVVTQRIYSKDGTLLATAFQEGVVRLRPPRKRGEKTKAKL
ncbi:Thioesterase/thiol ester dehydrase-isomerase [Hypoxylon sp. FL1284]|nr:Thioesterase/thiol ester dehydrase-isomerase [Hypoxylon sp. FL1284]